VRRVLVLVLVISIGAAAQMWPNPGPGMRPASVGGLTTKTITIDHTKVGSSDSTNFPMLVSGTYSYLKTVANGGTITHTVAQPLYSLTVPADLKFATASGCSSGLLKWEFETYSATTGAVNIWVQVPTLSHTADTVIYMCYGDNSVTAWQGGAKGSVWDANYKGVWHLGEAGSGSAGDFKDASSNGTDSASTANQPVSAAGEIGNGQSFNGTTNIISTSNYSLGAVSFTMSAWVKPNSNTSGVVTAFGIPSTSRTWMQLSSGHLRFYCDAGGGGASTTGFVATGAWSYVAVTYDGTIRKAYINGSGESLGTASLNVSAVSSPFNIGSISSNSSSGVLDEARVSAIARSSDWILAEYNNQSSPATFYTITP
jgi:hypothetical protein